MKTIRWGLIGCGDVTERKSGPGFRKAANSELVAVMRRNGPLARDYARRHGVPRWHDDADAIIRSPDIDAVYIATLTDSHCEYALRCAAAGKPVYVEKPMAMTNAECRRMIDACRERGVPIWVGVINDGLNEIFGAQGVSWHTESVFSPAFHAAMDGWEKRLPEFLNIGWRAFCVHQELDRHSRNSLRVKADLGIAREKQGIGWRKFAHDLGCARFEGGRAC